MKKLAISMLSACLLTACGGGGSDWLSFDRNPVRVKIYVGESPVVRLTATASSAPSVPINVGVFVDGTVFDASSVGYEQDNYSVTFHGKLLPTLSVGTHTGFIEARVCEDDATVCAVPYDKSPWKIPVIIDVAADPGNPTSPANGDFSDGMTDWHTYAFGGGVATFSVSGGALHVNVASGGPSAYSVQANYGGGIDLEVGRTYRLSFDARADSARTIDAYVHEGDDRDGDGTGAIYSQWPFTFTLGTTMQTFSTDFTMFDTNRAAGIWFGFGASDADVVLDNVTVTDVTI
jgi:hypothetical protein